MDAKVESFVSAAKILCDDLSATVNQIPDSKKATIHEIRLRADKPLTFSDGNQVLFVDRKGRILYSMSDNVCMVTRKHIYDTFRRICSYSVYSYQNEIKKGFITVQGGHRVGLCGTAVLEGDTLSTVNEISSMNIRIARQIKNVSDGLMKKICPLEGGVLIAGPPSSGKTTMIRDMAYKLSVGDGCKMMKTAVIDERGEIAGMHGGKMHCDLGLCDVLNGYPKGEGIISAIRSLSPQVIVCDELGTEQDCIAVSSGFNAGAYIIATIHAKNYDELMKRKQTQRLLETGAFRTIVLLESSDRPCKIDSIIRI